MFLIAKNHCLFVQLFASVCVYSGYHCCVTGSNAENEEHLYLIYFLSDITADGKKKEVFSCVSHLPLYEIATCFVVVGVDL